MRVNARYPRIFLTNIISNIFSKSISNILQLISWFCCAQVQSAMIG